jgi:hypothetical protein
MSILNYLNVINDDIITQKSIELNQFGNYKYVYHVFRIKSIDKSFIREKEI